jgi:chitinase
MKTKLFTTLVLITLLSSCTTVVDLIDKYKDKIPTPTPTPTPDSGFKNPTIPPNPQGRVQLFSLT